MKRLSLILLTGFALALVGCASTPAQTSTSGQQAPTSAQDFEQNEMVQAISEHLGVTSESAASVIERLFREKGRPVGYITGEEGGGALGPGLFYGKGTVWMKDGRSEPIFWQGPTIGFDTGIDASKVFTLVYGLADINQLHQRFPKAEGSAYLVAGMGVSYQQSNDIILAPIRSGVGVRLGANIGYSKYSDERKWWPF